MRRKRRAGGFSAGVASLAVPNPPEDEALVNSYQLFYGAIKEHRKRLSEPTPLMPFLLSRPKVLQSDFNDNYACYQQASEKQAMQGRQGLMTGS